MSEAIFDMTPLEFDIYMAESEYVALWCMVEDLEMGFNFGARNSGNAFGRYTKKKYGFNYYEEEVEYKRLKSEVRKIEEAKV